MDAFSVECFALRATVIVVFQGLLEQKANAFMVGHVEKQPEQNVRRRSPFKVRSDTIPMMDFSF